MGRYYWRPNYAAAVDYGNVDTDGSGAVLGDNNDGTRKKYYSDSGSILSFVLPSTSVIPAGKSIIAVRVGHRQVNDSLLLLPLFNGWVRSYLRYKGVRQSSTIAYKQDGWSTSAREILGAPLYNKELVPWTWTEIGDMGAESGANDASGIKNRWCAATEVFIQLVYDDNVPVPTDPYPANASTIDTSSVQFSAKAPATQVEQPLRTLFQVCRVNTFDNNDVRTFTGGLNNSTDANSRSYYVSDTGNSSYTNLGPGVWYLRIKNQDYRGIESAWSSVTSFSIVHGPLPNATITDPVASQQVNSPYRNRSARITTQPLGGRRVGVTWQFAKDSAFTTSVVQWTNSAEGTFTASADYPFDISYNPTPNPATENGLHGGTVGVEDPSQYLAQGVWYARVRCTDVWGQSGPWSSPISFTVTHPPVPANLIPTGGASFDQAEAPVKWSFTDPWAADYQTAYQMRVLDSSSNLLQDTGKVSSGLSKANMSVTFATYFRQILTMTIDVWDADDVKNNIVNRLTGTCRLSKAPVTTITFPLADDTINSGQPNFTWTNVFAVGGITQASFRLVVREAATGNSVYDSGVVGSASTSHMPTRPILKNIKGYQVGLTVTDSEGLSKTVFQNFSTNFDRPEIVDCITDVSGYEEYGYTEIDWPTGNPDPYFKEWRVYRKRASEDDDQYVLAGVVENADIRFFHDWLIAGNDEFVYTVVQAAYRYGSLVESEYNPTQPFHIYSSYYWLIVPTNPQLNVRLTGVNADRYTQNREMADYNIIGGGRRRAYGTKLGKSGNLTIAARYSAMRTPTRYIKQLEAVCDDQYSLFMRDPFGNVTLIALGEISLDRLAGVGSSEFGDIDLPYVEVGSSEAADVTTVTGGMTLVESPPGSGLFLVIQLEGVQ